MVNVEASIQAAFVDFGLGRNGFLHISDLMPTYFGRRGEDIQESVGRKMARGAIRLADPSCCSLARR